MDCDYKLCEGEQDCKYRHWFGDYAFWVCSTDWSICEDDRYKHCPNNPCLKCNMLKMTKEKGRIKK
jgi:hypothetical protein